MTASKGNGLDISHFPPPSNVAKPDPTEITPLIPPEPIDGALPPHASHQDSTVKAPIRSERSPSKDEALHTSANQSLTPIRGALVTIALGSLIFIQATNMSMLTTTQSSIASDLEAFELTSWFTSAYLITMSALAPLGGKLSSVFSPRSCIFVASLIMVLGSGLCAGARTFEMFITGRAIQGVGAAGVFTISIIIVLELTGSKRRGLGIGILNSTMTFGVAIGATAAGALLPIIGWRALFWIQLPVCLFGGLILLFALPADFHTGSKSKDPSSKDADTWKRLRRLDYTGAITLTSSLAILLYAFAHPKGVPLLPIVLSGVVGATFVLNEIYMTHDPIIPIALMRSRGLLLTCLGTVGFMMARWSVLFYAPTYALAVRIWSPSTAGAMLIPTNLGFAMGGLLVGWLHIKRQGSFYIPTLITYAVFATTMAILGFLAHDATPAWLFVLIVFICGFATGAATNYNLAHLLHLTPPETHYVGTALLATFRGFAGSFGSAIGGGIFGRTLRTSLKKGFADLGLERRRLIRELLGSPALVGQLEGPERDVAVNGYQDALKVLWLSMALIALAMFFVQAGTGWKGDAQKKKEDDERQALLEEETAGGT